jgi:hypothetical protein
MGTDRRLVYVSLKVYQGWTYEVSRCFVPTTNTPKHNVVAPEERR